MLRVDGEEEGKEGKSTYNQAIIAVNDVGARDRAMKYD